MKKWVKWLLAKTSMFNIIKCLLILFICFFLALEIITTNNQSASFNKEQKTLNSKIKLEGIENTTIDHRVVDINLEAWLQNDNKITADELDGYTKILNESFYLYNDNVNEIIFPNSMKELDAGIIVNSRDVLKRVFIPKSVDKINGNIFIDSTPEEIIFEAGSKYSIEDGCVYENDQKKLLMIFPNAAVNNIIRIKSDTKIIAPFAFSNLIGSGRYNPFEIVQSDFDNVVEIQENAFYDANIKTFSIPNSVKNIGSAAFSGFIGTLSSQNSRYVIDNKQQYDVLLDNNTNTAMALINPRWKNNEVVNAYFNYDYIGDAFKSESFLLNTNNLTFGPNVKEIGNSAFGNIYLNQIVFEGNKITKIGNFAFSNINNGTNSPKNFIVNFPSSIISLGEAMFYNSSQGQINIPSSVKNIGTGLNFNAWKVNIDLDSNNQYYEFKNGLLIEKATNSIIGYDYDWLIDSNNNGKFVITNDIKYIQPRSLTMLMLNPNFKGIEIQNPNIIIGNGAFLNSGTYNGNKIDMIVPTDMSVENQRYIITSVMSWEFGPIQDTNLTSYGGGSWRGTVNGKDNLIPIPKPDPFPPPSQYSTDVKFSVPEDFFRYSPSAFYSLPFSFYEQWFTIINASINPKTLVDVYNIKTDNLNGQVIFEVKISNALISNELQKEPIYKTIAVDGFKKTTSTTMYQSVIPEQKIPVPNVDELNNYIDWSDTGDIINHDYLKYTTNGGQKIYSKYCVEKILNSKGVDGYYNNFYDNKLHIKIRIDNYYNQNGNFIQTTSLDYTPLYITLKLNGFILLKMPGYEVKEFTLYIIFVIIGLVLLSLIIAIILMTWKRKGRNK